MDHPTDINPARGRQQQVEQVDVQRRVAVVGAFDERLIERVEIGRERVSPSVDTVERSERCNLIISQLSKRRFVVFLLHSNMKTNNANFIRVGELFSNEVCEINP